MPEYEVTICRTEIFKGRITADNEASAEEIAQEDVASNNGNGKCLMRYTATDEADITITARAARLSATPTEEGAR